MTADIFLVLIWLFVALLACITNVGLNEDDFHHHQSSPSQQEENQTFQFKFYSIPEAEFVIKFSTNNH